LAQELADVGRLPVQPFGLLPGNQPILLASDDEQGTADLGRPPLHRQLERQGAAFLLIGRSGTHHERLTGQRRQRVPVLAEAVGTAQGDARLDAVVPAGDARRVVATQADPPDADAFGIDVSAGHERIHEGPARHLPVRSYRQVVLGLPLPRPVDAERRQPSGEELLLGRRTLLLGRVQPRHEDHCGVGSFTGRRAQHTEDRGTLERDLEAFAGRVQVRQRSDETAHRRLVRRPHLRGISDVDELGEVVGQ
jgi:hypothetical protein